MNSKHICKFCKRSFPCGRSLGGHIRSHLIHKNNNNNNASSEEPDLSKPRYELRENPKKTYKDSKLLSSSPSSWCTESENETRVRNPKGKSCFIGGNHSNSVSEVVEPEEEDISGAMCLIMLSRDFGNWGDVNSVVEDGDHSERIRREKIQGKDSVFGSVSNNSKFLKSAASGYLQNGSKMKELEVFSNGYTSNDQKNQPFPNKRKVDVNVDHKMKMEVGVSEDGFASNDQRSNKYHESGFEEIQMGFEFYKNHNKRSKFECTTCNKVFHSYQALGGHRASHKKMLGLKTSHVSKLEPNDLSNAEEDFVSPPRYQLQREQEQVTVTGIGSSSSTSTSQSPKKVIQKHECPICFRVFSSGQALGGHKRSHLLANNNNPNCEINLVERSSSNPEIRDFLDLNLPPVAAEEEANTLVGLIKPYWWVETATSMSIF